MRPILLLAFCWLLSLPMNAQSRFWEGGVLLGISKMGGDLGDSQIKSTSDLNPAFGLMARRYFHTNLAFRLNLLHSRLSASDDNQPDLAQRGFSTQTPLTEFSIDFELDILGHRRNRKQVSRFNVSPYLLLGMGFAFTNPETTFTDIDNDDILLDEITAFSSTRFALPLGAGLRFNVSRNMAFALEVSTRATFSDFLDGVSYSANPQRKDWYGFGSVQAWYRLSPPDEDEDGIPDAEDMCPEKKGVRSASGCPDKDEDGVADSLDACVDVPGKAAFNGCPDSDDDGVPDSEDACPTQAGPKSTGGCPDTDGDGLADGLDQCPEEAGSVSNLGCPSEDLDKDGVENERDECPDLPGPAANNGCPYPDSDGDGIADLEDKCPTSIGTPERGGCPVIEIEKAAQYMLDFASRNVRFASGSDELLPASEGILFNIANVMRQYPDYRLKIESYTDNVGSPEFNMDLSRRRAQRCFDSLEEIGVPASRMKIFSYGENYPIATNITEEGRKQNRRVEFTLF